MSRTKKYKINIIKKKTSIIGGNKTHKYKNINKNRNGKHISKIKTQKGGLFGFITHWKNMYKFNNLIKNLQLEEKNIKKYLGSYKANANIFKNLAEDKRDRTTEYVLNRRQQKILDFVKLKSSELITNANHNNKIDELQKEHDINLSKTKDSKIEISIIQANKDIFKKIPEFKKDINTLEKKSKKFRELVETLSTGDLGNFQSKIKLLKKEYDEIVPQSKGTLKSIHKKVLNDYKSHKADYDKVVKLDETYIQQQQALVHEIFELLKQGQFYIEQMESLENKKNIIDTDIVIWEDLYTKIYELLDKIISSIKNVKKQIIEIKVLYKEIEIAIHPISQNTLDLTIKKSFEEIKTAQVDLEYVIKFLDASASNINEILNMLLTEKMASQMYYDSSKIASVFISVLNKLEKYKTIFTPISINKQLGGVFLKNVINNNIDINDVNDDDYDYEKDFRNIPNFSMRGGGGKSGKSGKGKSVVFAPRPNPPSPGGIIPVTTTSKFIHPICFKNNNGFDKIFARENKAGIRMLFIYNENFDQYKNYSMSIGSGNGAFRPNRQDLINKATSITSGYINGMCSLGIPTGKSGEKNLPTNEISNKLYNYSTVKFKNIDDTLIRTSISTMDNNQLLELSMQNIYKYIIDYNITDVYYSSENCDTNKKPINNNKYELGINEFKNEDWTKYNLVNINLQFQNLINELIKNNGYTINFDNGEPALPGTPAPGTPAGAAGTPAPGTPAGAAGTPAGAAGTPAGAAGTPGTPTPQQIYLNSYNINSSNLLEDSRKSIINVKNPPLNTVYLDDNSNRVDSTYINQTIKVKQRDALVKPDGTIYFDSNNPKNNSIRSIISAMYNANNNKIYDNNIKIIEDNTKKINDIISKIIEKNPKSEFMLLTERVQELSQLLLKLSQIEPKVIDVKLDQPKPLALQYSWILKPVEINKSEFHALSGTDTLDSLFKENQKTIEYSKDKTSVSDTQINSLINKLIGSPQILSFEEKTLIQNSLNNNYDSFINKAKQITSGLQNNLCNIYKTIMSSRGIALKPEIEAKIKNEMSAINCGGDKSNRGGRGRGRGRGGYGNWNGTDYGNWNGTNYGNGT